MAEITDGSRDDGIEHTAAQALDDGDMSSTNSRLAQMAGMPLSNLPAPPPPPSSMGMGFPLGLNSHLNPEQENGKPPQNDGLPKATLLEPELTRSLLLGRGNLPIATTIPPLMPSINRPRSLNQSGDDSREFDDSTGGPKIPQVLEKILQLKEIRQEEMILPVTTEEEDYDDPRQIYTASETEEETTGPKKEKKNRRRRNRKKRTRRRVTAAPPVIVDDVNEAAEADSAGGKVEIEYVTEEPDIYDPNFIFFKRIFQAFKVIEPFQ